MTYAADSFHCGIQIRNAGKKVTCPFYDVESLPMPGKSAEVQISHIGIGLIRVMKRSKIAARFIQSVSKILTEGVDFRRRFCTVSNSRMNIPLHVSRNS